LTDASGRKASVANAIIVLTMNVPTGKQGRRIGFGENAGAPQDARKEFEQNVVNGVKAQLRPELVNRLGHIVPFHELGQEDLRKIVEKILARLNQQLQPRQVEVSLAAKTYELIIARGFNPQYGARGMERTFEELIAQPLARKLLERNVTSGRILATAADNGAIEFTSA
jgi:ATP-dependent Clp protease ATP-binding subunit ClpC